ncbi:MAG: hypothetical protein Q4D29_12005 [Lachnospiraceae bacterium]|nr:hypothetical protein [Lachnospiraceae bacterium]
MFDKDFRITGKHANYWKDLCELAGNVPDRDQHDNFKIFSAYIDAYVVCPLIGYQYNRKGVIDNSVEGNAGMLAEVFGKRRQELKYVYQIIMLLDEESEPDEDKRLYRAFKFSEETPEDKALIEENMKVFNAYFLGGLEIMHEEFVEQCQDADDYLKQMYDFVKRFHDEQDGDAIRAGISKYLDK